jgi:hypothetical protein
MRIDEWLKHSWCFGFERKSPRHLPIVIIKKAELFYLSVNRS